MRTITLEIPNSNDWQALQNFLASVSIRVVEEKYIETITREEKLKEAFSFWENKAVDFRDFKFNRDEAHER